MTPLDINGDAVMQREHAWEMAAPFGFSFWLCLAPLVQAAEDPKAIKDLYRQGHYTSAFAGLHSLARQGDTEAQVMLCDAGAWGNGIPRLPQPSQYCYMAAKSGNGYAHGLIAMTFLQKENPSKEEFSKAFEYAMVGDNIGDALSSYVLGEASYQGLGTLKDGPRASYYFNRASNRGHDYATFRMGMLNVYGMPGISINVQKGIALLKQASDKNAVDASYALGQVYLNGHQGVPVDLEAAARFFTRGAQLNDPKGHFGLFELYTKSDFRNRQGSKEFALKSLQQAAKAGYAPAQHEYGYAIQNGTLVTADTAASIPWFIAAQKQGYAASQLSLGAIYLSKEHWNPQEAIRMLSSLLRDHPGTAEAARAKPTMAALILYQGAPGTVDDAEKLLREAESSTSPKARQSASDWRKYIAETPPKARISNKNDTDESWENLIEWAITHNSSKKSNSNRSDGSKANCLSNLNICFDNCDINNEGPDRSTGNWHGFCCDECKLEKYRCTGER